MKRILILILAVLIAATCLVACSSGKKPGGKTQTSDTQGTTRPEEIVTHEADIVPDLPEEKLSTTFQLLLKEDMYISEWDDTGTAGGSTIDLIDEALFSRNAKLQNKYDCFFEYTNIPRTECLERGRQIIFGGDVKTDFLDFGISELTALAGEGALRNVSTVPYVDYSKPYWYSSLMAELESPNGSRYFAVGYGNLCLQWNSYCVIFNQTVYNYIFNDDIFETVRNGEWTLDLLLTYAKQVYNDKTGDGPSEDDFYGIHSQGGSWYATLFGGGMKLVEKDENGNFQSKLTTETVYDRLEKVLGYMADFSVCKQNADQTATVGQFKAGEALFLPGPICGAYVARDMDDLMGIVPSPLAENASPDRPATEQYYTHSHYSHANALAIPSTVAEDRLGAIGIIWEDSSYLSKKGILNAMIEVTLLGRTVQEAESAEMMEIVFSNIHLDPIFIYCDNNCNFDAKYREMIRDIGKNGVVGDLYSTMTSLNSALQNYLDKNINIQ